MPGRWALKPHQQRVYQRSAAAPQPALTAGSTRSASELGRILIYEAAREWLPTIKGQVQTPLGISDATFVDPMQPIKVRGMAALFRGRTLCSLSLGRSQATASLWDTMLPPQVVPILRAGLVLLEQAAMLLPVTQTFHVGYVRNDDTLEVTWGPPGSMESSDHQPTSNCLQSTLAALT